MIRASTTAPPDSHARPLLRFRLTSSAEVRRRLTRRFPAELVDRVIEALRSKNYLDDEEFARRWRLNRERFHPRGRRVLKQELSRFGVTREVIDQALVGMEEEENAYRAGLKLAIRLMSKDCTQEDLSRKLYPFYGLLATAAGVYLAVQRLRR